ncbi:hypothetical protein HK405_008816, partial [Cladochytrium tenue]
ALAEGYEHGIGCERDPEAAARWRDQLFQRTLATQQVGPEASVAAAAAAVKTTSTAIHQQAIREYKEAIRSLEWGLWSKGISVLDRLSQPPFSLPEAVAYLDPDQSPLKNPTGMFWVAAHFERRAAVTSAAADEEEKDIRALASAAGGDAASHVGVQLRARSRDTADAMAVAAAAWYAKAATRGGTVPRELSDVLGDKVMPAVAARRRQDGRFAEALAQIGWGRYDEAFVTAEALAAEGHPGARALLDPVRSTLRNPAAAAALLGRLERRAEFIELEDEERRVVQARERELERCRALAQPAVPLADLLELDGTAAPTPKPADGEGQQPQPGSQRDDVSKVADPDPSEVGEQAGPPEEAVRLRAQAAAWRVKLDALRAELISSSVNPLTAVTEGIAALGGSVLHALPLVSSALTSTSAALSHAATSAATAAAAAASRRDATAMVAATGDPVWARLDAEYRDALSDVGRGRTAKGVTAMFRLARGGPESSLPPVTGDTSAAAAAVRPAYAPALAWLDPFGGDARDPAAMAEIAAEFLELAEALQAASAAVARAPDRPDGADGGDDNEQHERETRVAAARAAAAEWYRRAAEGGNGRGMVGLGRLLMTGVEFCVPGSVRGGGTLAGAALGISGGATTAATTTWQRRLVREPWQAIVWYMKAWDAGGSADAAYEVGRAYVTGVEAPGTSAAAASTSAAAAVVQRDDAKARDWLRRAAGRGQADAQNLLGELLLRDGGGGGGSSGGNGKDAAATSAAAEAVALFRRAAAAGQRVAMLNLGTCLLRGVGAPRDETQALLWLTRASAAGATGGGADGGGGASKATGVATRT